MLNRGCDHHVPAKAAVSVVVHPGRLRQEMVRRGWAASDLARASRLSEATVSAALAGRPIAAKSLMLMAEALERAPANNVVDSLIMANRTDTDIDFP
jgi:transcriptional regulator with XRE-family HTH domain